MNTQNEWIDNDGVKPFTTERVDTLWESGEIEEWHGVDDYHWGRSGGAYEIVAWRLHGAEQPNSLEDAYDSVYALPTITKCPPMPHCKPSKKEGVLVAFNKMTGHSLTEDELSTLRILLDVFGE